MYGTLLLFKLYTYFPCSFYYVFWYWISWVMPYWELKRGVGGTHPVRWDWGEGVNTSFHPPPWSPVYIVIWYMYIVFFFQIMSIPTGPSVAIIGGGVSGLVCAIRLNQLGLSKVTVFDTGKDLRFSITNLHIIRLFPKVKLISRSVSEAKI